MTIFILILVEFVLTSLANECPSYNIQWEPENSAQINIGTDYRLESFDVNIFNNLPPVNEVIHDRHDTDKMLQRETMVCSLGQTLVKQGVESFVGVSILHNHYHLDEDEVDADGKFIGNVKKNIFVTEQNYTHKYVPYMFKFNEKEKVIYPIQYILDDINGTLSAKFKNLISNDILLANIGNSLQQSQMTNNIGLFIRYYDGSTLPLHEETDVERRKMTLKTGVSGHNTADNTLITAYSFDSSDSEVYQNCDIRCVWFADCYSDCAADDDKHYSQHHDHGHHETGHV